MPKKWAYIIIITVVTIAAWSGWEIYKAFGTEKDVGQYSKYAAAIPREFDTALVREISSRQEKVLVKDSDIAPKGNVGQ